MGHVFRDAAWRIACLSVCLVCLGVWHKYTCVRSFRLLPLLLQRDLSSLELTISLSFILFPFLFLCSPLIEPGALNSQKLILSIILAHNITVPY